VCLPFDYDMDVISSVMNPSNSIFSAWSIYCFFFLARGGGGGGRITDGWKVGRFSFYFYTIFRASGV